MPDLSQYVDEIQAQSSVEREDRQQATSVLSEFVRGTMHGAVEAPYNGVAQLANEVTGAHLPKLNLTHIKHDPDMSAAQNVALEAGTSIGAVAPLFLINKIVGRAMGNTMANGKTADILGTNSLERTLSQSAKQGLVTGAIYGGVLTPSSDDTTSFIGDRVMTAGISAVNFSVFNTFNDAGRYALAKKGYFGSLSAREFMLRELPATVAMGTGTGAAAGILNAEIGAVLANGRQARSSELMHGVLSGAIMGGAFAGLHQIHSRNTQAAMMTEQQAQRVRWAERNDGQTKDWVPLYEVLFPISERQDPTSLAATMTRKPDALAQKPAGGVMHESYAPNGKLIAASINEAYPARPEVPGEKGFILGAYTFVHPEIQSAGVGPRHLKDGVMPSLKREFPGDKYVGRVMEMEATDGLPENSQPQRRARFFRDKIGLDAIDKTKLPYELPLFQPEDIVAAGKYIEQREIPKYSQEHGLGLGDGPVPAEMLWTSFDSVPLTGKVGLGIYQRLMHWGYGVRTTDPYFAQRSALADVAAPEIRVPITLNPSPAEYTPMEILQRRWQSSLPGRLAGKLDGSGLSFDVQAADRRNE